MPYPSRDPAEPLSLALDRRRSGVLLHPTSLPGEDGIGDLGATAQRFLHWMKDTGQSLWQILPLHPPALGNSPYSTLSSVAGNPLMIALQPLRDQGLLPSPPTRPVLPNHRVDYREAARWKLSQLRLAWKNFLQSSSRQQAEFESFRQQHDRWLETWSLFESLRQHHRGRPWWRWPAGHHKLGNGHREAIKAQFREAIHFNAFLQYLFDQQWQSLRATAESLGILLLGDVPIYVAHQSAEVWGNSHLFDLDVDGSPQNLAGVPPDAFSEEGQLWGHPLYRWEAMRKDGYLWWITRLRETLRTVDWIRLDHFRGFSAFWEVPGDASTARHGRWAPGPGLHFFEAMHRKLGPLPLVAEDLGEIDQPVRDLLQQTGFPGMKVLQFSSDHQDDEHRPEKVLPNSIYYPGTHDNDTLQGWYRTLDPSRRASLRHRTGAKGSEIHWALIDWVQESAAQWTVIPMQDILGLGSRCRMNRPGKAGGNWTWRLNSWPSRKEDHRLRKITEDRGRRIK